MELAARIFSAAAALPDYYLTPAPPAPYHLLFPFPSFAPAPLPLAVVLVSRPAGKYLVIGCPDEARLALHGIILSAFYGATEAKQ